LSFDARRLSAAPSSDKRNFGMETMRIGNDGVLLLEGAGSRPKQTNAMLLSSVRYQAPIGLPE